MKLGPLASGFIRTSSVSRPASMAVTGKSMMDAWNAVTFVIRTEYTPSAESRRVTRRRDDGEPNIESVTSTSWTKPVASVPLDWPGVNFAKMGLPSLSRTWPIRAVSPSSAAARPLSSLPLSPGLPTMHPSMFVIAEPGSPPSFVVTVGVLQPAAVSVCSESASSDEPVSSSADAAQPTESVARRRNGRRRRMPSLLRALCHT
jgi:hypothetical protein